MVLIVCFAFSLCWTPFFATQIIGNYSNILRESNFIFILLVVHLFSFSNSLMNPVIYFLLSQAFRRGFLSIMACLFPCLKSWLFKDSRGGTVIGVSTSEVGENSRGDLSGSRKHRSGGGGHSGGRGMSWRGESNTQYTAISEAPEAEEFDMTKIPSSASGEDNKAANHHHGNNNSSSSKHDKCTDNDLVRQQHDQDNGPPHLQKIEEIVDSEQPEEHAVDQELIKQLIVNIDKSAGDDRETNTHSDVIETKLDTVRTNDSFTDIDLTSSSPDQWKANSNADKSQEKSHNVVSPPPPPQVIVNSYS